jgi:hypothetical protein
MNKLLIGQDFQSGINPIVRIPSSETLFHSDHPPRDFAGLIIAHEIGKKLTARRALEITNSVERATRDQQIRML